MRDAVVRDVPIPIPEPIPKHVFLFKGSLTMTAMYSLFTKEKESELI
jgi:hypothetical protein